MMGYRWLRNACLCDDFVDTQACATTDLHDLLPSFVGKRLGKFHCVHVFYYIDVYLYVKEIIL